MPRVLELQRARKQGLYAPLTQCGAVLVDGTAVSCYAIPDNLRESYLFKRLMEVTSASCLQAACHALFTPLRLATRAAAPTSIDKASLQVTQSKEGGPIH